MILREFTNKDSQGKNRVFLQLSCDSCGTLYERQKRWCSEIHGCTAKCKSRLSGTLVTLSCSHCATTFERSKSSLSKSKSGLYFCSRSCKDAGQTYIEGIKPAHYGESSYRKKALATYGSRCNRCGYDSNIAAIEVHHIDKNHSNNEISNLEVLCANCHAIEHRGMR